MSSPKILAFAGSARSGSFNRRLLRVAVRGAEANGAACTVIELGAVTIFIVIIITAAESTCSGIQAIQSIITVGF